MFRNPGIFSKRFKESIGMMLIGDAVLALLEPERHVRLWAEGPRLWKKMMTPFLSRPGLTRIVGGLELGLGLWLSSRQQPPAFTSWKFWKNTRRT